MKHNPFKYGGYVTGDYFCNRKREIKQLQQAFADGQNITVISPRRWGKSSLVKQSLDSHPDKIVKVFLDCFKFKSSHEFYNGLLKEVLIQSETKLEALARVIGENLGKIAPFISFSATPDSELSISINIKKDKLDLDEVLELANKLAESRGVRYVICVDEFQNIKDWKDGNDVLHKLRSYWQKHENVSYCLYGSKRHIMDFMFKDSSEPFFRFGETLYLGKIEPAEWRAFIKDKFDQTGKTISEDLTSEIVELADTHSHFIQYIGRLCWNNTETNVTPEILVLSYQEMLQNETELFKKIIGKMTQYQLNYLRAIASGITRLTSNQVIREFDLSSSSNVIKIEKAMKDNEVLDYTTDPISFSEPYFKPLLKMYFMD